MKYDKPDDIPDAILNVIKTKKTYIAMARRRARDMGMAFASLSDDVWRQVYWDKSKRRHDYYRKVQVPDAMGIELPQRATVATIAQSGGQLDEYVAYYQDPAPNDLLTIQQLISMQTQLTLIDQQITDVISAEDIDVMRWQALTRIQKELSQETRMLQETLGISRKAREARKQEEELADRLKANIEQARQLLDERGVKLVCEHCSSLEGKKVMQGFVIHHFPEMGIEIKTRCPACLREYVISRSPEKWERHIEPPL
jgi:rubrerythrin